jgi:hypothetical protein
MEIPLKKSKIEKADTSRKKPDRTKKPPRIAQERQFEMPQPEPRERRTSVSLVQDQLLKETKTSSDASTHFMNGFFSPKVNIPVYPQIAMKTAEIEKSIEDILESRKRAAQPEGALSNNSNNNSKPVRTVIDPPHVFEEKKKTFFETRGDTENDFHKTFACAPEVVKKIEEHPTYNLTPNFFALLDMFDSPKKQDDVISAESIPMCSKKYNADFIREPRGIVWGERACSNSPCWFSMIEGTFPFIGDTRNAKKGREYLFPHQWKHYLETGKLPEKVGYCRICKQALITRTWAHYTEKKTPPPVKINDYQDEVARHPSESSEYRYNPDMCIGPGNEGGNNGIFGWVMKFDPAALTPKTFRLLKHPDDPDTYEDYEGYEERNTVF